MKKFNNALEIFKLLDKTNCKECGKKTCLAFAGAVFTGEKKIHDCPYVDIQICTEYQGNDIASPAISENINRAMQKLKEEIALADLCEAAQRCGGTYLNGKLTITILGKKYSIFDNGEISTDLHIIPWVSLPAYNYVLYGGKKDVTGNWMPFRELPSGKDWFRLFGQRCEKPLKKVADRYPDLFEDIVRLFAGKQVENQFDSDISVVLYPFTKLPMLICYWKPENDLESELNLFFDETAEDNLDINSINSIGSGFVTMLEKLTHRHAS